MWEERWSLGRVSASLAGPAAGGLAEPLVCVCAGRPASDAETLLKLQSFSHMAAKLRSAYELLLLLASPALGEPGACLAVAAQADVAVAGLPTEAASGRGGRGVRRAIRRLPAPALGAVVVA